MTNRDIKIKLIEYFNQDIHYNWNIPVQNIETIDITPLDNSILYIWRILKAVGGNGVLRDWLINEDDIQRIAIVNSMDQRVLRMYMHTFVENSKNPWELKHTTSVLKALNELNL